MSTLAQGGRSKVTFKKQKNSLQVTSANDRLASSVLTGAGRGNPASSRSGSRSGSGPHDGRVQGAYLGVPGALLNRRLGGVGSCVSFGRHSADGYQAATRAAMAQNGKLSRRGRRPLREAEPSGPRPGSAGRRQRVCFREWGRGRFFQPLGGRQVRQRLPLLCGRVQTRRPQAVQVQDSCAPAPSPPFFQKNTPSCLVLFLRVPSSRVVVPDVPRKRGRPELH